MNEQQIERLVEMLQTTEIQDIETWRNDFRDFRAIDDLGPMAEAIISEAGSVRTHLDQLKTWEERFHIDPLDAFSWGETAIRLAAKLNVAKKLSYWVTDVDPDEWETLLVAKLTDRIMSDITKSPPSSTSQISNVAEGEERHAWGEFLTKYQDRVKFNI